MNPLHCGRCGALRDTQDNFCRSCGHQLTVNLPVVQRPSLPVLPVRPQAIPPQLVGSMAVLALGTGLEWLARRFASNAARSAGRALVSQDRSEAARPNSSDTSIEELLYIRKIQIRR